MVGYGDRIWGVFGGWLVENWRILVGKELLLKTRGVWVLLEEDFWELYVVFEEKWGFRKSCVHNRLGVWEFWMKKRGFSIQPPLEIEN